MNASVVNSNPSCKVQLTKCDYFVGKSWKAIESTCIWGEIASPFEE